MDSRSPQTMNGNNPQKPTQSLVLEDFIRKSIGPLPDFFEKEEGWRGLYDHCLIEAARAAVFAEALGFSEALKKDLILASFLHDGHKKLEIAAIQAAVKNGQSGREASNRVAAGYFQELRARNIPDRTVRLIGLVGGAPKVLIEIRKLLDKKLLSEEELAAIVVHYIDNYTIGGDWVSPVTRAPDGAPENDVDRRMARNESNPNYKEINAEDSSVFRRLEIFDGLTSFDVLAVLSHAIERRLSPLSGLWKNREPSSIPEVVDETIKDRLGLS